MKTNVKSTWFFLPDWLYYVIKSIMTLNSKDRWIHWMQNYKDTAAETQTNRNTKNYNIERRKPNFTKRIGEKCRLL